MTFKYVYRFFADILLGFFFEEDAVVKEIEKMDAKTFRSRVLPARFLAPPLFALFSYKDPLVKALVWNIKFRMNRKCVALAGAMLHEELLRMKNGGNAHLLVLPVPISRGRRRQRMYNQTELLVTTMMTIVVGPALSLEIGRGYLKKKHATTQTSLSRAERKENLKGSFMVTCPEKIVGRDIVVIDDVITTGTTMNELVKVLNEAGAKSVQGLALAH